MFRPLTTMQTGIYFDQLRDPSSPRYNVGVILETFTHVDPLVLKEAIALLSRKLDILSMSLVIGADGGVLQQFDAPKPVDFFYVDLSADDNAVDRARTYIDKNYQQAFNLLQDQLLAVSLYRIHEQKHFIVIKSHHIILDGYAVSTLTRLLWPAYLEVMKDVEATELADMFEFKEEIVSDLEYLNSEKYHQDEKFWLEKLQQPPELAFPQQAWVKHTNLAHSLHVRANIEQASAKRLRALVQETKTSLQHIGLAALIIYFASVHKMANILIGVPVHRRKTYRQKRTIGTMAGDIPCCFNGDLNQTLGDLLNQISRELRSNYRYAGFPQSHLLRKLNEATIGRNDLFDVVFNYEKCGDNYLFNDEEMIPHYLFSGAEPVPLHVRIIDFDEVQPLAIYVSVHKTLMDEREALLFAERVNYILKQLTEVSASTNIGDIDFLPPVERQLILQTFAGKQRDYPGEKTLASCFAGQVNTASERTAVSHRGVHTSYGELDAYANRIAYHLRQHPVSKGQIVAIYANRSVHFLAAMLAIWKTGAVYVPLDPKNPTDRIEYMLGDANPAVVFIDHDLRENFPQAYTGKVISFDDIDAGADDGKINLGTDSRNYSNGIIPEDPAYLIYTSGSTGRPKGALVHHGGAVHHIDAMLDELGLIDNGVRQPITMLQSAAASSDISLWQFMAPLISGGITVILDQMSDMPVLVDTVVRENVELMECVPVVIRLLLEHLDSCAQTQLLLPGLRWMMATGDTLSVALVNDWLKRVPHVPIINAYGPSETSDDVTIEIVRQPLPAQQAGVSIGRPIANTSILILDENAQLLPVGVPGELCIAGAGVGLGYWNSVQKTAEKFVANPFAHESGTPGNVMYLSGDLAKWNIDGTLDFIGRADNQVKIRGHRVELGDIEACIAEHPAISDVAVITYLDAESDLRLLAFVTIKPDASASPAELRNYITSRLPDYMVPANLVILDQMPRNAADKIDRKALQSVEIGTLGQQCEANVLEPMDGEIEIWLADLWATLMGIPLSAITRQAHFFTIGGHSLTAVRLVASIKSTWQIDMEIRHAFANPTFAAQVAFIEAAQKKAVVLITPAPELDRFPLSYAQQRVWFIDQFEPDGCEYNASVEVHLNGAVNVAAFERAFFDLVQRHAVLRTNYLSDDEQAYQQIRAVPHNIVTVTDIRDLGAEEQQHLLSLARENNNNTPFNLARDAMVRCNLVRVATDEWVLLMAVHHIASDGWSQLIMMREIAAFYDYRANGVTPVLPDLPIQYSDYAYWQRTWLVGERLDQQRDYWLRQLQDLPGVHNLPLDFARPVQQSHRGGMLYTHIERSSLQQMHIVLETQEVTLFMVLMAVFSSLLHRYSGDNDVVIGSPVANREQAEISDLVGFFVNTLVYRNRVTGSMGFNELLAQCKQNALDSYANQQMPFEMLVDALQPARCSSYNPLFQIMLTLESKTTDKWSLPGVDCRVIEPDALPAQFDLSLDVKESDHGLELTWNYATDLFEAATIERMAQHFRLLLLAACDNVYTEISKLSLLDDSERSQLLTQFNDTHQPGLLKNSWPELFEQQVLRTPDATAARCGNETISYHRLEQQSRHIVTQLRQRSIGQQCIVALFTERNIDWLVAVVAILRSGAAYLPLDPEHPTARILTVLEQTQPDLLLMDGGQDATRLQLRETWDAQRLLVLETLGGGSPTDALDELENSLPFPEADDLAYVIFTSGSTGTPKGVMVPHKGMVNNMLAKVAPLQLTAGDVIAQTASQCFDISVWQLLTSLLLGATTEIITAAVIRDPDALLNHLAEANVTIWEPVPSMLRAVLDNPRPLPALRCLLPTGEALTLDLARAWLARYPRIPLFNVYGPAECSDDVTMEKIEHGVIERIWIGTPVANARVHILDSQRQLVPVGVIGEIAVSGPVVGLGYLHQAALTETAFIANPFCQNELDTRMYLTGDLGRRSANGKIEYIGRVDHQVKIRGLRIELGEIESRLRACAEVSGAAVIAHTLPGRQAQLIAFVVNEQSDIDRQQLRQELAKSLPGYMVPDRFIQLSALPLNANGKIDRNALNVLVPVQDERKSPPDTETEVGLASIWSALLSIPARDIYLDSDFFACGGHSLLAVRVVSAIKQTFAIQLPVRDIFDYRELNALANHIDLSLAQKTTAAKLQSLTADEVEEVEF